MKVFTVSQINRIIKDLIDNEIILEDIVVQLEKSWVLTPNSLFRYAAVPYQDFEVFFLEL